MIYCLKTWPCRTYWYLIGVRARVICRTWHLSFSQVSSLYRSCWQSALLFIVKYTAVSSSNSLTSEWVFSGRSFIYKRNCLNRISFFFFFFFFFFQKLLTVLIETLCKMSLQVTSLTILFKTDFYYVYIHLRSPFLNIVHNLWKMAALIHHIVSRPWPFTVCSLVA